MLRERVGCPVLSSAAGRPIDEKTGLSDYRARFYDPGVGRFISEDPSGFAGGDTNLFRYVGNDPLDRVDPSGLTAKWAGYGGKGSVPAAGWGAYGLLASGAISPANSFTGKSERGVPFVEFLVTRSSSGAITPQSSLPDTRSLSGYDRVSLGVHGTLSIAGAVPFLGIVPDAIDLAYTAAELPFGKSSKTDLAFATAGIAATAAPFIGDGAAAALKMSARVARIGGNTASDVVRVAGRFDDVAGIGTNAASNLRRVERAGSVRNTDALSAEQISQVRTMAGQIGVGPGDIQFVRSTSTYSDKFDKILIGPNVLPSSASTTSRSVLNRMTPRAVVAHEAGHMITTRAGKSLPGGTLLDEVQASLVGRQLSGLSNVEKMQLLRDAVERARESGTRVRELLPQLPYFKR